MTHLSKEQLVSSRDNLREKITDAATMTNGIMVANGAALASGFLSGKMAGDQDWKVMGLPVPATAGTVLAAAALLGMVGKKGRRTALHVSMGLTAPYLEKLGRELAKKG